MTPSRINHRILLLSLLIISVSILPISMGHETGVAHTELVFPAGMQKLIDDQASSALAITLLGAFLAGIVSFTSPCGFVLLPAYFAIAFRDRRKSVAMTLMFSVGLVITFTIMGVIAGVIGNFYNPYKLGLAWLSGIGLVAFGILTLLGKGIGGMHVDAHAKGVTSLWGMVGVGALFALGWTPCIGAVLGGILLVATGVGSVFTSSMLLLAFSLGVVIPLIIVSSLADRYDWNWMRGRMHTVPVIGQTHTYNLVSGLILIVMGGFITWNQGTSAIEALVVEYTPWSMALFVKANGLFARSTFFTSMWAQGIGLIVVIVLLAIGGRYAYRLLAQNDHSKQE